MRKFVIAALFFSVMGTAIPVSAQTVVGEPIHSFDLMDLNGAFRNPNQFKGKILGIFLLGHD